MPLYLGSKTVSENINMGDTVIQNTFDLFDVKWSDHIINNESWICADDFNWIDGTVFSAAWNELKSEWDLATIDSTPPETETIGTVTISYWRSPKGYKLVNYGGNTPEEREQWLEQVYTETGIAWYYLIDTTGQIRFKLPRTKYGFVGVRSGAGNFVDESLPNLTGTAATDGFTINNLEPTGVFYNAEMTYTGRSGDTTTQSNGLGFNASLSSSVYQDGANVQQKSTEMHLYFYLADFVRTPLESNLNTFITETKEALNEKVNVSDYSADKTTIENDINTLETTKITQTDLDNTINTQRTNCITAIPQNIKLELNEGTLTLKAGSKVYIPNGSGVFVERTASSDISRATFGSETNSKVLILVTCGTNPTSGTLSLTWANQSNSESGTTPPSNIGAYYNTNENTIWRYSDGVKSDQRSFPIAEVTMNNGTVTSIDQVFNGFGYIGSTVFALPGVEGLIPNGRNPDGSLNNTKFKTTSVVTSNIVGTYNGHIVMSFSVIAGWSSSNSEYDFENNINKYNGTKNNVAIVGTLSVESGRIISFNPKTVFHAVDRNEINNIIDTRLNMKIQLVNELPANPEPDVLYCIPEE